jgi:hypothetical protein
LRCHVMPFYIQQRYIAHGYSMLFACVCQEVSRNLGKAILRRFSL